MTILPTLKKLIPSEPTLLSDQNLWSNSPYGHSFLQFWTNERTSNCSVNTHWVDWSDSSHTRPPVTGLKYHTIGCVALWKRVSNLFFSGSLPLFPSVCHKMSRSTLQNDQNYREALLAERFVGAFLHLYDQTASKSSEMLFHHTVVLSPVSLYHLKISTCSQVWSVNKREATSAHKSPCGTECNWVSILEKLVLHSAAFTDYSCLKMISIFV